MKKKIAIVYTKNPLDAPQTMDMIRWHALSKSLSNKGFSVDMITVTGKEEKELSPSLRVIPIKNARWNEYAAIKSCYQPTISYIPSHQLIISRLARVIGPKRSSRDKRHHSDLLKYQDEIYKKAKVLIVNDEINKKRWLKYYGDRIDVHIIPTGCPEHIPEPKTSPFFWDDPTLIFMGTLNSERIVTMLNKTGIRLKNTGWRLAVVGKNKTHYYCAEKCEIDKNCCEYFEPVSIDESWNYLQHADLGLAIAPGPLKFENETSKIYYYLRAGLPVICEDKISNSNVFTDLRWGKIFKYGNVESAAEAVLSFNSLDEVKKGKERIIKETIKKHGWETRADIIKNIIENRS